MKRNPDNPSTTFFWNDWDNEPGMKFCSLAAQGLWVKLLSLAARSREYGVVLVGDHPSGLADLPTLLAPACGESPEVIAELIEKLITFKVASIDGQRRLYNRRMVAEAKLSAERANAGRAGAAATNAKRQTFGKGVGKQVGKAGSNGSGKSLEGKCQVSPEGHSAISRDQSRETQQNGGKHAGKSSGSSFFILSSVSKDTGADAPGDAAKKTFRECLAYLIDQGETEKTARSQLGQWRRDFGDLAVHEAVETARARSVSNPIPYIRTCLRGASKPAAVARADGWEAMP